MGRGMLKVGQKVHNFTVTRVESINELNLLATKLKHDILQTEVLHLEKDDTNNCGLLHD